MKPEIVAVLIAVATTGAFAGYILSAKIPSDERVTATSSPRPAPATRDSEIASCLNMGAGAGMAPYNCLQRVGIRVPMDCINLPPAENRTVRCLEEMQIGRNWKRMLEDLNR
jgi:hypothetical protein